MLTGVLRLALVLAVIVAGAGGGDASGGDGDNLLKSWVSKGLSDHPLVGRIYAPHEKKFVTPKAYLQALAWPRFVLLGEVHDNPDHHRLQALALKYVSGGDQVSVVFEHFRADQQTVIDAFQAGDKWMKSAGGDDQVERLFLVTRWKDSGWPDQKIYRPLVGAVLQRNAKIVAGNPPKRRVYEVARKGLSELSRDAQRAMLLDRPLGEALDESLLDELEASHCGLMPKSAFGNMAVAQRFRDGYMARAMVDAAVKGGPVVLVAGNGHVRIDRGVPWYIERMLPEKEERPLVAVGHVEVIEGKTRPEDYADAPEAYSLIVFTPRAKREDPCEAMRKRFGKRKGK